MGGRLDRTTTNCCKGIAAIIIMLHHISFRVSNLPVYVKPIWYIAFPIVGFFFFMSGYGLTCGLLQKKNYVFVRKWTVIRSIVHMQKAILTE